MKRIIRKAAACALALTLVFGASAANVTVGGTLGGAVISASAATTKSGSWNQSATPSFIPSENKNVKYSYSSGIGTWNVSSDHKTLTLNGNGSTKAFESGASTDWQQWKDTVEEIKVDEGITELNARCFYNFSNLKSVTLPSTLTTIGYAAFLGCTSLKSITLPASVEYVHYAAFSKGNANFEITLSDANQKIADLDKAFVTDSSGNQTSNLDDIAVISGVTLTDETIDYYLDMFPNAEVGGKIRITPPPTMELSADGSRFTIKGYVPLTTKRTVEKYNVTLGSTTPTLTATGSGSQGTFTAACSAKEMADVKPIVICVNGIEGFRSDSFSVAKYLKQDEIINNATYGTAAKSMLRYGAAAQTYFGYKTDNLANIDDVTGIQIASYELTSLSSITPVCSNPFTKPQMSEVVGITFGLDSYFREYSAINMTFTADTTLMLAFRYADNVTEQQAKDTANSLLRENFTNASVLQTGCGVTAEDVTVDTDLTGNYAVLRVKNVPLMKLDTPIFEIGDVKVCATQYLAQVGNSTSTKVSDDLRNLCKALYKFYDDASKVSVSN